MALQSLQLVQSSSQSAYIADGSQTGLDPTGDFSIGGWFKPSSAPTGGANDYQLVGKYYTTGGQRGYQLTYEWNSGSPRLAFYNSSNGTSGTKFGSISQTLTTGTWYYVSVSCDISAGTAEIFVKALGGSMSSIGTITGLATSQFNTNCYFSIGGRTQNNNTYSDGRFAYWRFFSSLMSLSDWDTESDNKLAQAANNEGDWVLNGDLLDSSANGNNLTNHNGATFQDDNPLPEDVVALNNFLGFSRL